MNVIFHTSTAIALATLAATTNPSKKLISPKSKTIRCIGVFFMGIAAHAVLDYAPHCYPINSKVDVILSSIIILASIFLASKNYRLILAFSVFGNIFPDIVDLSPAIINKQLGLKLPIFENFFPWHWREFSGSIYTNSCRLSSIIHISLAFVLLCIFYFNRISLYHIFRKN